MRRPSVEATASAHPLGAVDDRERDHDCFRGVCGDVEGQPGLADTAGAGERHDGLGVEEANHLLTVVLSSDHRAVGPGDARPGRRGDRARGDPVFKVRQCRRRVEPGLVHQSVPEPLRRGPSLPRIVRPPQEPVCAATPFALETAIPPRRQRPRRPPDSPRISRASSTSPTSSRRNSSRPTDSASSHGTEWSSASAGPRHRSRAALGSVGLEPVNGVDVELVRLRAGSRYPRASFSSRSGRRSRGGRATGRRGCRAPGTAFSGGSSGHSESTNRSVVSPRSPASASERQRGRGAGNPVPRPPAPPREASAGRAHRRSARAGPVHHGTVPEREGSRHGFWEGGEGFTGDPRPEAVKPDGIDQRAGLRLLSEQRRGPCGPARCPSSSSSRASSSSAQTHGRPSSYTPNSSSRPSSTTPLTCHGVEEQRVVALQRPVDPGADGLVIGVAGEASSGPKVITMSGLTSSTIAAGSESRLRADVDVRAATVGVVQPVVLGRHRARRGPPRVPPSAPGRHRRPLHVSPSRTPRSTQHITTAADSPPTR